MKKYDYVVNVVKERTGKYYVKFSVKNRTDVKVYINRPNSLLKALYLAEYHPLTPNLIVRDFFDTLRDDEIFLVNNQEYSVPRYYDFGCSATKSTELVDMFDENEDFIEDEVAIDENQINTSVGKKRVYRPIINNDMSVISRRMLNAVIEKNETKFEKYLTFLYDYIFGETWHKDEQWMDCCINHLYQDWSKEHNEITVTDWEHDFNQGLQELISGRREMLDDELMEFRQAERQYC